jgi:hypothetical protein
LQQSTSSKTFKSLFFYFLSVSISNMGTASLLFVITQASKNALLELKSTFVTKFVTLIAKNLVTPKSCKLKQCEFGLLNA